MDTLEALYTSAQERQRPEDVAALVMEVLQDQLGPKQLKILRLASQSSLHSQVSSMGTLYARLVGADRLVNRSAQIFEVKDQILSLAECLDPQAVERWLIQLKTSLHAEVLDFHHGRLSRDQQRAKGFYSKRAYNRRFRCLRRLQMRCEKMQRNSKHARSLQMAKSSGAIFLSRDLLKKDLPSACFVAYLAARLGLRSTFTNKAQVRAFDEVAEMLLNHVKRSPTVCWEAIAYVHPDVEVLQHLDKEKQGELFGLWTEELRYLAGYLRELWLRDNLDLQTMVVRQGNNSSAWNAAAGAWNKARDQWFSLLYTLGLESLLNVYCPGKVMRLMAADVAYWHSLSGKPNDPATLVWRELPKPWDVFSQRVICSKEVVQSVCDKHGIPSWVQPPPPKRAVAFTLTPELVHGVSVSSPFLAKILRKAGVFSGKAASPVEVPVVVMRECLRCAKDRTSKEIEELVQLRQEELKKREPAKIPID